jgi:hypothetical protein
MIRKLINQPYAPKWEQEEERKNNIKIVCHLEHSSTKSSIRILLGALKHFGVSLVLSVCSEFICWLLYDDEISSSDCVASVGRMISE